MFQERKATKVDLFRKRLKHLEYFENLIIRYQTVIGRTNYNYYYSTANPSIPIPSHFKRKIDLIDSKGLKLNLKNHIIYLFLLEKNCLTFNKIMKELREIELLSKWAKMPKRVSLNLAELKAFNIILAENEKKDIKNQKFILNYNILHEFYGFDYFKLKKIMRNHFFTRNKKK
jgi:hypothetical protein